MRNTRSDSGPLIYLMEWYDEPRNRRGFAPVAGVPDRDDTVEAQRLDERSEVFELLFETVDGAGEPVGLAESQWIERDELLFETEDGAGEPGLYGDFFL
jgi:hypothetical protein